MSSRRADRSDCKQKHTLGRFDAGGARVPRNLKKPVNGFGFEQVIQPVGYDTFLTDYWETRPLLVTGRPPDYYSELFSTKVIDHLISAYGPPKSSDVRIAKDSEVENLTGYLNRDGTLDLNKLYKAYSEGFSIVLDHCKQHPPLSLFFKSLERTLNHPVGVTVFLTPRRARAFRTHLDGVDTFILQVEGTKHWNIYDSMLPLPLGEPRAVPEEELPELLGEVQLKPGDFLYIPRGFVHEALTSESYSLHLSVYLTRFTWLDLISSALSSLGREHVCLRKSLPPGFLRGGEPLEAVKKQFGSMLKFLAAHASVEDALDQLAERLMTDRPPPDGHFSVLEAVDGMETDTVVKKREGLICRVTSKGDSASIRFSGGRVTGPLKIEPALQFIARWDGFPVSMLPGGLKDREKLVLARRLVREGLLTVVGEGGPPPK